MTAGQTPETTGPERQGPGTPRPDSETTRWLDERENRAWRSFLAMQSQLMRALGKELQEHTGLSEADYAVLVLLSEAPTGRLRPFELGLGAGWEKSRLSHHISRMERRGLVERQQCPSDNRGALIVLTPSGRQAIERAAPFHLEQVRARFVSMLSEEQLESLTAIAETVLSGLHSTCQAAYSSAEDAWEDRGPSSGDGSEGVCAAVAESAPGEDCTSGEETQSDLPRGDAGLTLEDESLGV
jgi:DNA-binding MarR family transcriptional regulator